MSGNDEDGFMDGLHLGGLSQLLRFYNSTTLLDTHHEDLALGGTLLAALLCACSTGNLHCRAPALTCPDCSEISTQASYAAAQGEELDE